MHTLAKIAVDSPLSHLPTERVNLLPRAPYVPRAARLCAVLGVLCLVCCVGFRGAIG